MSKAVSSKPTVIADLSKCNKSCFTLTFVIEVLGIDVFHDCNEGWLDLGPCTQGMKLQYQLYYGQSFDIDILIWPHVAKIWCSAEHGWVRTWQFLEHRFLTFSISHMFPVRVIDFQKFIATVSPTLGMGVLSNNAKNDKNFEVYLPPLAFGDRRYFAPVVESLEESVVEYISNLIWKNIVRYIPQSYLDESFDIPHPVTDIRHQDAALYHVRENILNRSLLEENEEAEPEVEEQKLKSKRDAKTPKEKEKKKEYGKEKFEVKLTGDAILAGTGRVVTFEASGERPSDLGDIVVLITSNNLPAQDDLPIVFVNVDKLFDAPIEEFKKLRINKLYTRWILGEDVHDSQHQDVKLRKHNKNISFNDHHVIILEPDRATKVTAMFLDNPYEIQIRGVKNPSPQASPPKFFGYEKRDRDFSTAVSPKPVAEDLDFLIAVTKIDARALAKGMNAFLRGEYPLYPPSVSVVNLQRESICTNDINAIGAPIHPTLIVSSGSILEAQMTLEVSMGLVGCKPRRLTSCFSRLFCLIQDSNSVMSILHKAIEINENLTQGNRENLLTGFAIDTGDVVIFFMEGPRDGHILKIWGMTEDFYPQVKAVFSSSARYSDRIYPELILGAVPFVVLKMFVPLGVVLACPPIYARPALPIPTRLAALKIGRLIASRFHTTPTRQDMPTAAELKSFRLELCAPPRPPIFLQQDLNLPPRKSSLSSPGKVQPDDDRFKASLQSTVNFDDK